MTSQELKAQAVELAAYEAKRANIIEEYNHCINFRDDPLPITKFSYKVNNYQGSHHENCKEQSASKSHSVYKNLYSRSWVGKLGIPPPPKLTTFDLPLAEKKACMKRKREAEVMYEVFVKEDIMVDRMHRNLVPPARVVGSPGLVIIELEASIFFYNGSFDLVFQKDNEFHLATTPQLIRIQNAINVNSEIAQDMYNKMIYVIEAREDVVESRKIL
ncbi:hypothetical protein Tco_0714113 [Tanacetum coccineum]